MDAIAPALVSVVMPCFNAEPFIEEAIRSAFAQTHASIELIVVDDGSEDGSTSVVQRLQEEFGTRRLTLLHTSHAGPYPARNRGLQATRGDWIAFLDADDYWDSNCIKSLLQCARNHDADLAYCGWQNVGDVAANGAPYIPPAYEAEDTAAAFLTSCPWPIHAALIKRDVVEAIGGFSTRRFAAMDYDFWLRAYAHSQRIARVPEVLAFYRWHGAGQISAIKWRQVIDAWIVRGDFVREHPDQVSHLSTDRLRDLVDGALLESAYTAFWRRDLVSAQKIFRQAFKAGAWRIKDLLHIGPSLLPLPLFQKLISLLEH